MSMLKPEYLQLRCRAHPFQPHKIVHPKLPVFPLPPQRVRLLKPLVFLLPHVATVTITRHRALRQELPVRHQDQVLHQLPVGLVFMAVDLMIRVEMLQAVGLKVREDHLFLAAAKH